MLHVSLQVMQTFIHSALKVTFAKATMDTDEALYADVHSGRQGTEVGTYSSCLLTFVLTDPTCYRCTHIKQAGAAAQGNNKHCIFFACPLLDANCSTHRGTGLSNIIKVLKTPAWQMNKS